MASEQRKNIVVVGAGIIGSTTAYFLTRHPKFNPSLHSITLLEATGIASGASGKAGGLLALWAYPRQIVPLSFNLHKQLAEEHGGKEKWGYRGVGVGSIDLVGRKISKESIKSAATTVSSGGKGEDIRGIHRPDVASDGNVDVSLEKRSEESYAHLREAGLPDDLNWVAEECVRGYESMGTPQDTAQVHPYQFTTAMAQMAQDKGVKLVLGKVTGVDVESGKVSAVRYTENDSRQEKKIDQVSDVVITAGPWSKTVWPGTPIGALRAHSVTIRPSKPVSGYALFTQIAIPKNYKEGIKSKAQHVSPEIYARPNDELYACGEGDHLVPLPETSADVEVDDARCQDIIDYCASFSDEMKNGEVRVRQACYLPQVETGGGPLIGMTKVKGVFMAAGHTCWGIQNGPGTGKLMSEFVFDGEAKSANVAALDPRKVLR